TIRAVAFDVGQVLVYATRQRPRRSIVSEVHAGRADRRDRDVDLGLIEVGDRALKTPERWGDAARGAAVLVGGLPVEVRHHMVMEVDSEAHLQDSSAGVIRLGQGSRKAR